ncbi:MAG TPA: hypothetical protein VEK57_29710 [Thermoanaerobaculia bacterium]|nr:hypothetical protein [Thermoanaerobaculia bacterium]
MSEQLDRLSRAVSRFHGDLNLDDEGKIGNQKVLRPSLGEESTKQQLEPILEKTGLYLRLFQFSDDISDQVAATVTDATIDMLNVTNHFAEMNNQDYIKNKEQLVTGVESAWDRIRSLVFHAVAAGVLRQRLLQQDIDKRYTSAEKAISELSTKLETKFKKDLDDRTATVREYFDKREAELKRSAFKVSVEAAQEQFRDAGTFYAAQVRLWALLTILTIAAFAGLGSYLMLSVRPPADLGVIYFTAIRIVLLSAAAAVATFCLRILNLHMRAHNSHRLRVANSIGAFVEAARTNEQSDQILGQLVSAVASFGNSGLVEGDDRPIVPIEAISKVLVEKSK